MIKAYVLLTLTMGDTTKALKEIKKIEHINSIAVVAGIYDVVLTVTVKNLEELYDLTYVKLCTITGIKETTTFIVEKEIIPEEDFVPVEPGQILTELYRIRNTGKRDLINIDITEEKPEKWRGEVRVEPTEIDTLGPGEWQWFSLIIEADGTEASGTHTVTITSEATCNNNRIYADAKAILMVGQQGGVDIEPEYAQDVHSGETITLTHTITNLGNYTDTFFIQVLRSRLWSVAPEQSLCSDIGMGQDCTIQVAVEVPHNAGLPQTNTITVLAFSTTDPGSSFDYVENTIVAIPWEMYLPFVWKPSSDPFCNGDFSEPLAPCWTHSGNLSVQRHLSPEGCFARLGKAEDDSKCFDQLTPGYASLLQEFTPAIAGDAMLSFEYEIHTQDVLSDLYDTLEVYVDSKLKHRVVNANPSFGCDSPSIEVSGTESIPISVVSGREVTIEFRLIHNDTWYNTYADIRNVQIPH